LHLFPCGSLRRLRIVSPPWNPLAARCLAFEFQHLKVNGTLVHLFRGTCRLSPRLVAARPTHSTSTVGFEARRVEVDDCLEMKGDQGKMRLAARTAARLYKEYVKMQGCVVENWTKTSHERMEVEQAT